MSGTAQRCTAPSAVANAVIAETSAGLISLRLAMSLDGYIADASGSFEWIVPVPSCFLFGGGVLVESFLTAGVVDELTVGIVPVLLGRGRRLFVGGYPRLELSLVDYAVLDGKVRMVYRRR